MIGTFEIDGFKYVLFPGDSVTLGDLSMIKWFPPESDEAKANVPEWCKELRKAIEKST